MTLTIGIYDLQTNLIADISEIALEKSMTVLLDQARSFEVQALAHNAAFTDVADDGFPNLEAGDRKLLVFEDGDIIFHGRIFTVERVGDENTSRVTITAMDPLMELGYDSADRAGRVVRDETGNFITPTFAGTGSGGAGVVSGPDLIYQVLFNSMQTGDESDPTPGEGPLPIDLTTGTFDLDVPPAVDLSCVDTMDWPVLIGDFITQLVSTGVCDIKLRPVDPAEGLDPYVMVALSAVSSVGTDLSGSVHFDYLTGSRNAKACRHVDDFATANNKLYDYLGPRLTKTRWKGNITPGSPGTTIDPTDSRARYGTFMSIRIFDSVGTENSSRPLYLALWNAEQGYRVIPRELLWITPQDGSGMLYTPPQDFDAGDILAINVGSAFGLTLAESQRCYGYTKTWTRENVPQVSQLLTSADVSL